MSTSGRDDDILNEGTTVGYAELGTERQRAS
jgi:hypothetical protein